MNSQTSACTTLIHELEPSTSFHTLPRSFHTLPERCMVLFAPSANNQPTRIMHYCSPVPVRARLEALSQDWKSIGEMGSHSKCRLIAWRAECASSAESTFSHGYIVEST